jgi:hypothetical protein
VWPRAQVHHSTARAHACRRRAQECRPGLGAPGSRGHPLFKQAKRFFPLDASRRGSLTECPYASKCAKNKDARVTRNRRERRDQVGLIKKLSRASR